MDEEIGQIEHRIDITEKGSFRQFIYEIKCYEWITLFTLEIVEIVLCIIAIGHPSKYHNYLQSHTSEIEYLHVDIQFPTFKEVFNKYNPPTMQV